MKIRLKPQTWLLIILIAILAVRLISLSLYPLMDTTEARYAEMARKMLETGNWITPQYDYGTPFWGKPPLSFWASALTMLVCGINEFGARLAPFIASILTGLLFFAWPFKTHRREKALLAFIIMQSSVIGFISAGAVMTDGFLFLAAALCMISFWRAMQTPQAGRVWGYLFFIGLGLGLLAKGPLIFVLAGFPVFWWVVACRQWRALWRGLPWVTGIVLMLVIALPWYLAAENATPGFLRYFIIGEHFERFLVKGWEGDLYGAGHGHPMGTIWLYGLICALPWIILWPLALRKKWFKGGFSQNLYLLLWMLTPLLFFTFAGNILPAYVLPGLAAFTIITAQMVYSLLKSAPYAYPVGLALPGILVVLALALVFTPLNGLMQTKSDKMLLSGWDGVSTLIYLNKRNYSGQFYSLGKAQLIPDFDADDLETLLETNRQNPVTLVMRNRVYKTFFKNDARWQVQNKNADKRWYLVTSAAKPEILLSQKFFTN